MGVKATICKSTFFCVLLVFGLVPGSGAAPRPAAPVRRAADANRILALQICLDRRGLSCNTLDGVNGRKTQVALATWCALNGKPYTPGLETTAWETYFPNERNLFTTQIVTAQDVAALVKIPKTPEGKAALPRMGYETLQEMFAERGRLSQTMLKKLNPTLAWPNPPVGAAVKIPFFPPERTRSRKSDSTASVLRVSLSRFEITAFDERGRLIALFPCSIAASKKNLPPEGELHVVTNLANPDYTYTPDHPPKGRRVERRMFKPGPNNPVGLAWIGLSLPGYGIHGTPEPERIGRPASHGCFRLANWNAVRLHKLCTLGTAVVIEK